MVRCKITMSSSYATGGDTITGALVGIGTITKLTLAGASKSNATTHDYLFQAVYDSTGVNVTKIQAFWAPSGTTAAFDEVTSTTDLSLVAIDAIAYGT